MDQTRLSLCALFVASASLSCAVEKSAVDGLAVAQDAGSDAISAIDTARAGDRAIDATSGLSPADVIAVDAFDDVGCQPACVGRECGDDGCGGSCGSCPLAAPKCGDDGKCTFADCGPDCEGKECGIEMRCGKSCGSCPGVVPYCGPAGLCQADECVPDCMGESIPNSSYSYPKKECGPDGCGGLCGGCLKEGDSCVEGQCTTPCDDTTEPGCLSSNSKTFVSCNEHDGVKWRIIYKCDSQTICKTKNGGCVKD